MSESSEGGAMSKTTGVTVDLGVSDNALNLARRVDELPPGDFTIRITKRGRASRMEFTLMSEYPRPGEAEVG